MTFGSPGTLWALLALLPIILIQLRAYTKGRTDLVVLGRHLDGNAVQTLFLVKWFFSALTFNLFVALSIFALSDVTWGGRPVEEDRDDLDVIVALDISRSMLADDVRPSRLGRSLAVIRSVSRQLPAARFGLIAFKGDAVMLLPLTEDLNALEAVLDGVSPQLVSTPGTDLERGLADAIDAFPNGTNAHRAILLISDGESLSGSPARAATAARSLGIPVLTIIAGTLDGSTLSAGDGSLITDDEGRPVISRAAPAVLQGIAESTSSISIWLNDLEIVAMVVDNLLGYVERREVSGFRLAPVNRYPLFIGAALIALALSLAVRIIRWQDIF
ncbi:MAG: VWA domain-containing protein [Spirochaetia bacterium]